MIEQYRKIDIAKIKTETQQLIGEMEKNIPNSTLNNVAKEIEEMANNAEKFIPSFKELRNLKIFMGAFLIAIAGFSVNYIYSSMHINEIATSLSDFLQGVEALIQSLIFAALGFYFAWELDSKITLWRLTPKIDELRSMIHVIEMHQFDKDPQDYLCNRGSSHEKSTIKNQRDYTLYHEYCSKCVVLISKIAAYYAQNIKNEKLSTYANDLQHIATAMSSKFWQKIMVMDILVDVYKSHPENMEEFCKTQT